MLLKNTSVAEWYFQCVIVLSQFVRLYFVLTLSKHGA